MPKPFGVIHILIAGEASKDGLPEQSGQAVPPILTGASVGQNVARHVCQSERLAELEAIIAGSQSFAMDMAARSTLNARRAIAGAREQARGEVREQIAKLQAKIARFESDPESAYDKHVKDLTTRIKAAATENAALRRKLRKTGIVLSKAEFTTLRKALHPDALHNTAALDKAAALFNSLVDAGRIVMSSPA